MAADPDSEWIDDYAPGEDGTLTGEAVALDLHPTGFVLRAVGALIDVVASLIVYFVTFSAAIGSLLSAGVEQAVVMAVAILLAVVCLVGVPIAVETLTKGKSLGKLAIGGRNVSVVVIHRPAFSLLALT